MKIKKPDRLYQYLAAYTGLLSMVTSGMHYAWPSPSLPQLLNANNSLSFHITDDEGSWIAVLQLIGAVVACFFAATTVDIIGRKMLMILTAFPFFAAWLMVAFANSTILLCIARFMAGLADGIAFVVMPLYVGEIADPKIRGLLGASISAMWILGMLLINIIGNCFSIKMTAVISSVVPLVLLGTFIWMPESPYYLIIREKHEDAKIALAAFRGNADVDEEYENIKQAVKIQIESKGKFFDLFTDRANRRTLLVMAVLRNAQQMSGISAITFYTQTIFQEESDLISPVLSTIIFLSAQFIMSCIGSIIVDKTGRRPLLIITLTCSAIALFLEGTYFYVKSVDIDVTQFSFVPVVILTAYVIVFNCGVQPIPLLMIGELFPTNVKAFGSCLSEMYFSIVATVISKFFQIMKDGVGMYLPFYTFASCSLFNVIFVYIFVPETKGKTLEQIQMEYS